MVRPTVLVILGRASGVWKERPIDRPASVMRFAPQFQGNPQLARCSAVGLPLICYNAILGVW